MRPLPQWPSSLHDPDYIPINIKHIIYFLLFDCCKYRFIFLFFTNYGLYLWCTLIRVSEKNVQAVVFL